MQTNRSNLVAWADNFDYTVPYQSVISQLGLSAHLRSKFRNSTRVSQLWRQNFIIVHVAIAYWPGGHRFRAKNLNYAREYDSSPAFGHAPAWVDTCSYSLYEIILKI